jgi:hypothetical protein
MALGTTIKTIQDVTRSVDSPRIASGRIPNPAR